MKQALTSGGVAVITQLLQLLSIPVVTRLYEPSEYGLWALWISLGTLVGSVATLRYEVAIVLPKRDVDALALFCLCLGLTIISAILVTPLAVVFLYQEHNEFATGNRLLWLLSAPVLVLSTGFFQSLSYWLVRHQKYKTLGFLSTAQVVLTIAVQISLGIFFDQDASSLLIGTLVGQTTICVGWTLIEIYQPLRVSGDRLNIGSLAKTYSSYPKFMAPLSLISIVRERLVIILISKFGTPQDLGYFTFSNRLVSLPINLVSQAARPVLFRESAHGKIEGFESPILATMNLLTKLIGPLWAITIFYLPDIFNILFGSKWRDAYPFAIVLSFLCLILPLINWLDRLFDSISKQNLAFRLEIGFTAVFLFTFFATLWLTRNLLLSLGVQTFFVIIYHLFWTYLLFNACHFSAVKLTKVFINSFFYSALPWLALFLLNLVSAWYVIVPLYFFIYLYFATTIVIREVARWKNLRQI